MKILHVYKTYYPDTYGGVGKFIDQLILKTKDAQAKVLTLTSQKQESIIEMHGYEVHRIPQSFEISSCPFSWRVIGRFKDLASQSDIVHYHFPWPFADMMHFITTVKKPSLITYHSDILKQKLLGRIYSPLMHIFLRDVNHIIATSPNYMETSSILQQYKHKTIVIPFGLDIDTYPTPNPLKLKSWQKQLGNNFFLFIGGIRYYKGLQFLIEAAKKTNAKIVIVGGGKGLAELSRKASSNVFFLGELSEEDKVVLLKLCYGVVFPSHLRTEAFGLSLLEGAMFGKPLISCEIGTGTTYINIEGETGLVVAPQNPIELAAAIEWLLNNPKQANEMGKKAYIRYQQIFTAEKMASKYLEVYRSLMSKI